MHSKKKAVRQFLAQNSFIALGVGAGLAMCAAFTWWMDALQVHDLLERDMPDRVYVSTDCVHCNEAVKALSEHPGAQEVVLIPVDEVASPERAQICAATQRALRDTGVLRAALLSDEDFCQSLVTQARAWVETRESLEVPAWVIGGETLSPGWTQENIDHLKRAGLLASDFEFPGDEAYQSNSSH